jgi:hypothetical protein
MEDTKESLIPGDTPVAQGSSSLGVSCFCSRPCMIADFPKEHCVTDRPTRQSFQNPLSNGHEANAESSIEGGTSSEGMR